MILQVWIQPSFCLSQEYVSFIFLEFKALLSKEIFSDMI